MDARVALVTGGSGPIGMATIPRLNERGMAVVSLSRRGTAVDGADLALAADVTDESAVDAAVGRIEAELGPIDVLVHAAHPTGPMAINVAELTSSQLAAHFGAVAGYVAVLRRIVPSMRHRGYGRVVYVSGALMARPAPGHSAYGAAKSAGSAITRYLALEEGRFGITANVVAPGRVVDPAHPESQTPEQVVLAAQLKARMALPEWPSPADVADVISALVDMPAITGQTVWITGGEPMG
jgi:NAD(P)-dependent dehydrogenase (short-subunit alcohol dehydrogenase family)